MKRYGVTLLVLILLAAVTQASDQVVDGDVIATNVRASGTVSANSSIITTGSVSAASVNAGSASITGSLSAGASTLSTCTVSKSATFNNEQGTANHFRVKGAGTTGLIFANTQYDRVGIYTDAPSYKLDVRGATRINANLYVTSTTSGASVFKVDANNEIVEIGGVLHLRDLSIGGEPTFNYTTATWSGIYSYGGYLRARNKDHNNTIISPHLDPREIYPLAKTSFADPSVEYPFSFYHMNPLLGKEQAIDMAKMVAWTEKKMQNELGAEEGRLVFTRELPAKDCLTLEQYNQVLQQSQAEAVLAKLEAMPWIKVDVGANGAIPPEAFESVPVYETVNRTVLQDVKEIDCESMRLVTVKRVVEVTEQVDTGKTKRQLRSSWQLIEGELYRRPTINDVDLGVLLKDYPQLSPWVLDRINAGQQASMDVKTLADQIRAILAAKASEAPARQAAQISQ